MIHKLTVRDADKQRLDSHMDKRIHRVLLVGKVCFF